MPSQTFISTHLRPNEEIVSQTFEKVGDNIVVTETYKVTFTQQEMAAIKADMEAKKTELQAASFETEISQLTSDISSIESALS